MNIAGFEFVPDPSVPLGAVYLLPPDVRMAIETAENVESAYKKGRASLKMVNATVEYAEGVISQAAKERRIGVIKNVKL